MHEVGQRRTLLPRPTSKSKEKYFYRAVDKEGHTIDFLLTAKRDRKAALRFLKKAIKTNVKPGLINIDQSAADKAGVNE